MSAVRTAAAPEAQAPHVRKAALLASLVERELDSRYRGSILGRAWPLVTQVAQLLVFTYLFSAIFKVRLHLDGIGDNAATYGIWLFAGFIPWTAFAISLSQGAICVVGQQNLIKKVVFPLALLPLVPIFAAFGESLAGLGALIVLLAAIAHGIHPTILLLPLVWLPQILLSAGLVYLLSALTVFIRDVPQALSPVLLIWFYITPVVYPSSIVPPLMTGITNANPMTYVIETTRAVVVYGRGVDVRSWLIETLVAGCIFVLGFTVFRKLRPAFADVL